MNTPLSIRVVAGLWFVQYITERNIRQVAWDSDLNETDYGLLFGDDIKAAEVREKAVNQTMETLLKDRQILEILSIPAAMFRPTLLRELFKLHADDLLCPDFAAVHREIRDIWESGILKELYIDIDFGDAGDRKWRAPEIMRVFERGLITYNTDWYDIERGVDESYLTYMCIWAEGFPVRTAVIKAVYDAGFHPTEPSYESACNDVSIPHIGHYAAWRCLEIQTYEFWRSMASAVDKEKVIYAEKHCGTEAAFTAALVARGFPVRLTPATQPWQKLAAQIPGSYAGGEASMVKVMFELVARAVFRRFSADDAKRAPVFCGFVLDKDWEDYPTTPEQYKWNSLVTAICWGQEVTEFHNGVGCNEYDRLAYVVRSLYKIVRQELYSQGLIQ